MRRQLTFSIIADGGTDQLLVPILQWAIHRLDPEVEILEPGFSKRSGGVKEFLRTYTHDVMLLFVHRDSENMTLEERLKEFESTSGSNVVPVVPVRMSESWILFDGGAIARAAGSSIHTVSVPRISGIESISDPKQHLDSLLLEAAGNPSGRRGKNFRRSLVERRMSVASFISDYSPLEGLTAFRSFQASLEQHYPYKNVIDTQPRSDSG